MIFVLGGRSVGPWLTAFAYGTSYFSAVVFVGYAGQFGWKYGVSSTWIGLGNAIIGSLLAWVVLGRRTRVMTKHLQAATMPDYFGKRFDSDTMRVVASAIVFVFLVPYTASIYNGLSRLFGLAFDIPYAVCVIAMAALTGAYVILGGYMATAINDFIQGIIMLIGIVAVVLAVLGGQGGFMEAMRKLSEIPSDVPATAGQMGAFASFFGTDPLNLLGVVILTSLGTWGLPQMVHKFYAIKSEKAVTTGTVISTLFAVVISGGCYFMGGFGRLFDDPSFYGPDGSIIYDGIVPHMLSTLPDMLMGIVIVLVLSASMSTLSSLVLTSASTLTLDFLPRKVFRSIGGKKTAAVYASADPCIYCCFCYPGIRSPYLYCTAYGDLLGRSCRCFSGSVFIRPVLERRYQGRVWASFITGIGITVTNMFFHYIASPINAGAIAMVVGFIVVPAVSLISPNIERETVENIFRCYDVEVEATTKKGTAGGKGKLESPHISQK